MDKELLNVDKVEIQTADSAPFYSYRKVVKCLSDGVSLYTDNLGQVAKLTAPMVMLLAVMSVVCTLPVFSPMTAEVYVWIPVYLLFAAVMCLFVSVCYSYVMKKKVVVKDDIKVVELYNLAWLKCSRALFAGGVMLLVYAVYGACIWLIGSNMPASLVWKIVMACCSFILFLVFVAFSVPMQTATSAVLLERGTLLKTYFTGYKHGLKTWFRLFALTIMLVIIMCFVALLLLAPWYVVQMIDVASAQSVLNGDSVSISSGFVLAKNAVTFISAVLCLHLICVVLFVNAYFYASVKVDMKEREANEIPLI